jgi:hypothetical protein
VPEGSEFAARVYAAINARDRGAIKALSAPDIVVGTTVEAYRGAEVDHRFTHVWTLRDRRAIRLQSFAHRDDAVRYAQRSGGA